MDGNPPVRIIRNAGTPPPSGGRPRRWDSVPVGDLALSDAVEVASENPEAEYSSLTAWVYRQGQKMGKKFSVRVSHDRFTIWRVK